MIRHSGKGKRTASRGAGRRMSVSAVAVTIGAVVAALWLVASAEDGSAARGAPARPAAVAIAARLSGIPSHDGLYRASMLPSPDPTERNRPLAWTVVVRTAAGAPVDGAALTLESWMPDDTTVVAPRPWAAELGGGRYRVEGLAFDRPGWWNVRLRISGAAGTDSLAFNLIL